MPSHVDIIRLHLGRGPLIGPQLQAILGVSQPTLSRAIAVLGDDVVRFGAARSIR